MLTFTVAETRFTYRAAAVCIAGGDVLLHHAASDDFWSLPGGRCEMGEPATETVRREMEEETGAVVTVGPLRYVVENFFMHGGTQHHELGLYFACALPSVHPYHDRTREHAGVEGAVRLIFRWFPLATLADVPLYPVCLRDALPETTGGTRHILQRDTAANRLASGGMRQ